MDVDLQQRTAQYGHRRHHAKAKTRHGHAHGSITVLLLKAPNNGGITEGTRRRSSYSRCLPPAWDR